MQHLKINNKVLLAISLLVILASSLGLWAPDFYASRNNAITTYEIAGQDIISLASGALLLLLVVASKRVKIFPVIAAGLLVYTTYTYAYFLFGLVVSKIYVVYLVITGLSFYSIVSMLVALQGSADEEANSKQKSISTYLIIIVVLVGIIDGKDIIARTIGSNGVMDTKGAFYILDLAFLFPAFVIAAVMNIKGRIIGRFFTGAFLIKTVALMPALILSDILHYINRGVFVDFAFDVIAFVVMISAIFFYGLYHNDIGNT
jgi:hypothetical protein